MPLTKPWLIGCWMAGIQVLSNLSTDSHAGKPLTAQPLYNNMPQLQDSKSYVRMLKDKGLLAEAFYSHDVQSSTMFQGTMGWKLHLGI